MCRDFQNCPYIPRHLEHKCQDLSNWSGGYDAALDDVSKELKARLGKIWEKVPYASDVLEDNITKEQANELGRFAALESFESFIEKLQELI